MSKAINKAKAQCRPKLDVLSGWKRNGLASRKIPKRLKFARDVDRINAGRISKHQFTKKYIKPNNPVILQGSMDWWPAMQWSPDYFKKHHNDDMFRVGEDDDGKAVRLKMKHFLKYCKKDAILEDSPLYIFDSKFGLKEDLQRQYQVPSFFEDDLFELGKLPKHRPPNKWICIGPPRSGTNIHTDPLGTSAWNALIQGRKRWVLFPPETSKSLIYGCKPFSDSEGISWFFSALQRIKSHPELKVYDFIQQAGECVYVPSGWHHVVVNLDFTIAVTQNLCHPDQFEFAWLKTRNARPKFAQQLMKEIKRVASNTSDRRSKKFKKLIVQAESLSSVPAVLESSSSGSSSSEFTSDSGI